MNSRVAGRIPVRCILYAPCVLLDGTALLESISWQGVDGLPVHRLYLFSDKVSRNAASGRNPAQPKPPSHPVQFSSGMFYIPLRPGTAIGCGIHLDTSLVRDIQAWFRTPMSQHSRGLDTYNNSDDAVYNFLARRV
jgi:hypothetical protein